MATKITYTGSSKVIIRLCEAVNSLIDNGGGGGNIPDNITEQLDALREAVGFLADGLTLEASVENNALKLEGTGASVKGNHLLLISGEVSVSGNVLHFGGDTVRASVENNVLLLDGASVIDDCAVIVSPGASVRDNALYMP